MSKDLDYDGHPSLHRKRSLTEPSIIDIGDKLSPGLAPDESDPLDEDTTALFTDLGKVYLKGNALAKGIRDMPPAQSIPIRETARQVRVAAKRINAKGTNQGTLLRFSVYTDCVDILADAQWKVRRIYDNPEIPSDFESSAKAYTRHYEHGGDDLDNLLKSFFDGAGGVGALLMCFCVAPFQNTATQSLSSKESGAKAAYALQTIVGSVLLLELGYSAIEIIKSMNATADVDSDLLVEIELLENDPERRRNVLNEATFDYDKFIQSTRVQDCQTLIEYASSYIEEHAAVDPTVYDHWVAYINIMGRQNVVRGALDNATTYSKTFSEAFGRDLPSDGPANNSVASSLKNNNYTRISNITASFYSDVIAGTNGMYDSILNSFIYQISDEDVCCMISLFGAIDTSILKIMSRVLRIMAIDLQAALCRLMQSGLRLLMNIATTAVNKVLATMDKAIDKLMLKILTALEEIQEELGLKHCPILVDIGLVFGLMIKKLRNHIAKMLQDIVSYMEMQVNLRMPSHGWEIPADRRYLLCIATILDTMASKLDTSATCDGRLDDHGEPRRRDVLAESKDEAAQHIIHTLIVNSPPSIQISDDDIKKYFPDLKPSVSPLFGFEFGPASIFPEGLGRTQRDGSIQRPDPQNSCNGSEQIAEASEKIAQIFSNAFNADNG